MHTTVVDGCRSLWGFFRRRRCCCKNSNNPNEPTGQAITASEPSFSMRFHYYHNNSNNYYLLRTYVCRVGMADVKLCRRDSSQQNIYEKSNPYYQRPEETTRTHRYKILRRRLLILCVVGVWRSLPNINRRQGKPDSQPNLTF